ncbi:hypothetical protein FJV46_02655 [Arthrobacter agilis]|uniref:hypothetical protein n=1 Tax=Arthrobacter agilis TaxID=37921 RepID=UPI000B3527CA|nr:hypothetical protein [Arthrobacter agilis]OUM40758.1 hypothetical protein B8W74_14890 [Arthrobacter agilis]PPB45365.1 hypothetical protein CI784_14920 [Arthrobacter agilis]TPV28075.1 hypothetical protein FJV46_02655 [Arthrobacter agilis]WDF33826.1 hypothetical protein PTW37_02575 [Arthrobacter agilis]VDR31223.1 Uncharacterised protein [Arthrobacter agilis]
MTENLPDEELTIVGEDPEVPNDSLAPEAFDPVLEGQPDAYEDAAELNPDRWQEDPLLQDEPTVTESGDDENGVSGVGEEGVLSDQTLRDETAEARYEHGEEQVPPDEPMLGEAAADVDFGMMDDDDVDASDDPANRGGSPLSGMDQEDVS